jgi:hypothetical protein
MTSTRVCVLGFVLFLAVGAHAGASAQAERHVETMLQTRVMLTFKADAQEVQRWLPAGWQPEPIPGGPSKDSNLVVLFVEKVLAQDAQGKPAGPTSRNVTLVVPARNAASGESSPLVIRTYESDANDLPGFYKAGVPASVEREHSASGSGTKPARASERWSMKDEKGATIDLALDYERGTPARVKQEMKPRSAIDPATWRIYRQEQALHVVKSTAVNIDRIKQYRLEVKVPELDKLFDGKEQLVSVIDVPWYSRQTYLPQN